MPRGVKNKQFHRSEIHQEALDKERQAVEEDVLARIEYLRKEGEHLREEYEETLRIQNEKKRTAEEERTRAEEDRRTRLDSEAEVLVELSEQVKEQGSQTNR